MTHNVGAGLRPGELAAAYLATEPMVPTSLVHPERSDWALARAVHGEFSAKAGAQHIASEFSLAHLSALLHRVKPAEVLEFGAGIGTITSLLLRHPTRISRVTSTETNSYCLEQLARNLPPARRSRCKLVSDPGALVPEARRYGLVIIDSLVPESGYGFLAAGTVCFVDGNRARNRAELFDSLRQRGLRCDLVNYNRGVTRFHLSMRQSPTTGRRRPRFRWRRIRKGCWIGAVAADPEASAPSRLSWLGAAERATQGKRA